MWSGDECCCCTTFSFSCDSVVSLLGITYFEIMLITKIS